MQKNLKPMSSILLVEDDEGTRSMLRRALQQAGYNILEAEDGRVAFKLLADQSVDLVITDIIMPEVEGIELMRMLRTSKPRLPVIAISGGGRMGPEGYLHLAKTIGAAKILAKPFEVEELLAAIKELLGQKEDPAAGKG